MSRTTDKVIDEMNKCEHEYVMKTSLKHGRSIMICRCGEYYEVD